MPTPGANKGISIVYEPTHPIPLEQLPTIERPPVNTHHRRMYDNLDIIITGEFFRSMAYKGKNFKLAKIYSEKLDQFFMVIIFDDSPLWELV